MGTAAKLNMMGILLTALTLLGGYFVWSAQRWIDNVEAQSELLTHKQQQLERTQDLLKNRFDYIAEQLQYIREKVSKIEEKVRR